MKLTVLVDNVTLIDRYFTGEPGLSIHIETENKKILFDAGYSDLFIQNARKMNISVMDLDYVVFSHGHLDHTWGLDPLVRLYTEAAIEHIPYKRPVLTAHPLTFMSKTMGRLREAGALFSEEKLARHFDVKLSREPVKLTDKLVFLGEIPRNLDFEPKLPVGAADLSDEAAADYLLDDSALAYTSRDGLVIITGCSHSGICNIVDYARKVCNENRVADIIGGFHLLNPPEARMKGTREYIRKLDLRALHACHCTDLNSKIALSKAADLRETGVGLTLEYK